MNCLRRDRRGFRHRNHPLRCIRLGDSVLLAITLHEAAHGWAAWVLGDPTAKDLGRVIFNPLKHIDPFGTVTFQRFLCSPAYPFFWMGSSFPLI